MPPSNAWSPTFVLVTCEHAGNDVPDEYARCFADADNALASHRGLDLGASGVANRLATRLAAPLIASTTTRLLVDLNRSLDNPSLFSEFTRDLDTRSRDSIIREHYTPYRDTVTRTLDALIGSDHRVLHLGVHSCADELNGTERDLDISLLFDPDRASEASFSMRWIDAMRATAPDLRYRTNEPYLGTDDGLTTALRGRFSSASFAGIEIEVRQGFVDTPGAQRDIGDLLANTLPD
ncbi:MAG: N-formylglutamate amidohydrolase [Phycisphaerales bacterium]